MGSQLRILELWEVLLQLAGLHVCDALAGHDDCELLQKRLGPLKSLPFKLLLAHALFNEPNSLQRAIEVVYEVIYVDKDLVLVDLDVETHSTFGVASYYLENLNQKRNVAIVFSENFQINQINLFGTRTIYGTRFYTYDQHTHHKFVINLFLINYFKST